MIPGRNEIKNKVMEENKKYYFNKPVGLSGLYLLQHFRDTIAVLHRSCKFLYNLISYSADWLAVYHHSKGQIWVGYPWSTQCEHSVAKTFTIVLYICYKECNINIKTTKL
ncbi:hypothetical protein LSH36_211g01037 [Paralvinella palmiformis]|uniref:Uncharacterized protein n=1 Tax=Paralvinella palmiformis TaxID=53620 RepID=A0AAD9JQ17_9ANNE|nr:hypothetical protein LSH36_211g01037 [Paralvinella palmiformis]